jgi:hypothetical protein
MQLERVAVGKPAEHVLFEKVTFVDEAAIHR